MSNQHTSGPRVQKTCEVCGTVFSVPPYRKDTARFCTRICGNAHLAEKARVYATKAEWSAARSATSQRVYAKKPDYYRDQRRARGKTEAGRAYGREYARAYRQAHPGARTSKSNVEWVQILRGDPCSYCGEPSGETDHIVPLAKGGTDEWENLAAICRFCNRSKKDRSLLTFLARRATNGSNHRNGQKL